MTDQFVSIAEPAASNRSGGRSIAAIVGAARGAATFAVSIGARISSLAGPGEVLVSSTVKDLVAGSRIRFDDRVELRLKGVPYAWHLYALAPD